MPLKIAKTDILTLVLAIKEPFTVSFGTISERIILIVKLYTPDGLVGYGECDSFHFPTYVPDFTGGEKLVLKDFILPALLGKEFSSIEDAIKAYSFVKGHNFAKTAVESALWHIRALKESKSLKQLFGGTRNQIEIGESIGIKKSIEETLEEVTLRLNQGFKRIKVKIKHGWDLELTRKIREIYPDIPLMLYANSDYSLTDIELLRKLDNFKLIMIEQPLGYDDIVDHSVLQKELNTPICLDESILGFDDARRALFLKSCKS